MGLSTLKVMFKLNKSQPTECFQNGLHIKSDQKFACVAYSNSNTNCKHQCSGKRTFRFQSPQLVNTRVGTLIVATIYLLLVQNRHMFRSFTVLQCSHRHCVQPVASDVEVVGYL